MKKMFEELQSVGIVLVSFILLDDFIKYCNERGVHPSGGAFVADEAQYLYI